MSKRKVKKREGYFITLIQKHILYFIFPTIFCNSVKETYLFEIKRIRRITTFSGNELATVPIAVVCIALPVRVTLTDANIVKYNRQKEK